MAIRRPTLRGLAGALSLALALAGGAPAAAEEPLAEAERYAIVPRGGVVWRLDTATGELCVFDLPGTRRTVLNAGCAAQMEPGDSADLKRFALAGRSGDQVWRLDSRTGRVCVFAYRPVFPDSSVVQIGCSSPPESRGQ